MAWPGLGNPTMPTLLIPDTLILGKMALLTILYLLLLGIKPKTLLNMIILVYKETLKEGFEMYSRLEN